MRANSCVGWGQTWGPASALTTHTAPWEEAMKEEPRVVPDSGVLHHPQGHPGALEAAPELGVGSSQKSHDADNIGETFTVVCKRSK